MYLAALQITVYTRCRSGWMPLLAYAIKFSISLSVYVQLLFHFPIHFVFSLHSVVLLSHPRCYCYCCFCCFIVLSRYQRPKIYTLIV